ncbi:glycine--tRNA ligase [Candidatus Micrarchaeota archaeon]|nr:glycine--tRNA ligase [Candidatus Micrarchaeota archaeon]
MAIEGLSDKVASLCVRRGFIFPNSEPYGQMSGLYDFGPLGVELKRRIEENYWKRFVRGRQDVVGLDGAILASPKVWEASGHVASFNDPLVDCLKCKSRFRADHLVEEELKISVDGLSQSHIAGLMEEHKIDCPKCKGDLTPIRVFNLMFKTQVGPVSDESSIAYLRPETAQLIFVDFKQVQNATRKNLPFGIAQIGKAFRNEISPRNFIFRLREFNQMELEYFVHPKKLNEIELPPYLAEKKAVFVTATEQEKKGKGHSMSFGQALEKKIIGTKIHAYWLAEFFDWLEGIGINKSKLRLRAHTKDELSHYSSETWDVEYEFPWGFKELMGIANRTDFDLREHSTHSGKDLSIFDEATKEKVTPFVIEPSIGLDRLFFTLLLDAYSEGESKEGSTVVLNLSPKVSPVQVSVFPLMKKDGLKEKAYEVFQTLLDHYAAEFDDAGSIGKRYARNDEVGTPYCVTIDYDSLKDSDVTIRERGSGTQIRVKEKDLVKTLGELLAGKLVFKKAGKVIRD